jgi:hypothetical protein
MCAVVYGWFEPGRMSIQRVHAVDGCFLKYIVDVYQ